MLQADCGAIDMLSINLLKPGVTVYDDSEPGGIIDIKFKTEFIHKLELIEILWDKKDFNKCIKND